MYLYQENKIINQAPHLLLEISIKDANFIKERVKISLNINLRIIHKSIYKTCLPKPQIHKYHQTTLIKLTPRRILVKRVRKVNNLGNSILISILCNKDME